MKLAFSAMDSVVLGPELNRIPSTIHMLIILSVLLIGLRNRVIVMEAEYHTLRTGRFKKDRGQAVG